MTLSEARKILKQPLVFGNAEQIKAIAFLENVENCKEQIAACKNFKEHIKFRLKVAAAEELAFCERGCCLIEEDRTYNDDVITSALGKAFREWMK